MELPRRRGRKSLREPNNWTFMSPTEMPDWELKRTNNLFHAVCLVSKLKMLFCLFGCLISMSICLSLLLRLMMYKKRDFSLLLYYKSHARLMTSTGAASLYVSCLPPVIILPDSLLEELGFECFEGREGEKERQGEWSECCWTVEPSFGHRGRDVEKETVWFQVSSCRMLAVETNRLDLPVSILSFSMISFLIHPCLGLQHY